MDYIKLHIASNSDRIIVMFNITIIDSTLGS